MRIVGPRKQSCFSFVPLPVFFMQMGKTKGTFSREGSNENLLRHKTVRGKITEPEGSIGTVVTGVAR